MTTQAILLGSPTVEQEGKRFTPPAGKTAALLYYLAYRGEWVERDTLLYFFWPDSTETKARRNLSRLLITVKALPYTNSLEIEIGRLRWAITTDTEQFKGNLQAGQWSRALQVYGGELLAGVRLSTLPDFENWLELERRGLRKAWCRAALALAKDLEKTGRYPETVQLFERLYRADPLDEAMLRRYLHALFKNHQPALALEVLEAFRQLLQSEVGGEPDPETHQLAALIRSGNVPPRTSERPRTPHAPLHNLPEQPTPFVGRERELGGLVDTLQAPDCRLLTLTGPGGIGKTRMALVAAERLLDNFPDGVWFISLAPVAIAEAMVYAVADALGFTFYGTNEPAEQLVTYLRDKSLLLVMDNVEHLLGSVSFIDHLLAQTANLKILATSRERLNLRAEWLIDVPGIAFPTSEARNITDFDAVKLFLQSASRVRPTTHLTEDNVVAVKRICTLVQGMPLALELAASWVRALPLQDIADYLSKGLDVLQANTHDLPERHRSLRAVFDYSWALLREEERTALRRLSVFRQGFRYEAAASVAGTGLSVLAALIDKSFLSMTAAGRYVRHPLVEQYSREKLLVHPAEAREVTETHSRYYLGLVGALEGNLYGTEPWLALSQLELEYDNLRAALAWTEREDTLLFVRLAASLERFWWLRQHASEGRTWLAKALEIETNLSETRGALLKGAAALAWAQGDYAAAQPLAEAGVALRRQLGEPKGLAAALLLLGHVVYSRGEYVAAHDLCEEALTLCRTLGDKRGVAEALNLLGNVAFRQGNLKAAEALYGESLTLRRSNGSRSETAASLNNLGAVASRRNDLEAARRFHMESLDLKSELPDARGRAATLNNLGLVALRQGDDGGAEAFFKEALLLRRTLGDSSGVALALTNLGNLALRRGDAAKAETLHSEALALWQDLDEKRGIAVSLQGLGLVAAKEAHYKTASTYFQESLALRRGLGDSWGVAHTLVGTAYVCICTGVVRLGLNLLGATEALLNPSGATLEPLERGLRKEALVTARSVLGVDDVAKAIAEGRELTLEAALELASGKAYVTPPE